MKHICRLHFHEVRFVRPAYAYVQKCLLGGFDLWQGVSAISDRLRDRQVWQGRAHGVSEDGRIVDADLLF